jgi:hypothetical protein
MNHERTNSPQFRLGRLLITPNAQGKLPETDIQAGLQRHSQGDVDVDDWQANNVAVTDGTRILSAYVSENEVRFWIITEADRSATTVLLPEDY